MRIVVTGGTGFIGQALVELLVEQGFTVVVPSRSVAKVAQTFSHLGQGTVAGADWGESGDGDWAAHVDGAHGVVNLAGASVAQRWTPKVKKQILNSRVDAGKAVSRAVRNASTKPKVVVQGSAVGYYGFGSDKTDLTEDSPAGQGFLADVCKGWEPSTQGVEPLGVRRTIIRTGVVVHPGGGVLARMLPAFRLYAGGHLGSGEQFLSWISRADHVRAIHHLLTDENAEGPYNLTAPTPVTMREFCKELGRVLGRPSWAHAPGFVLRAMFGDMAREMLVSGQKVFPARLPSAGFGFRHKEIASAFKSIL